MKLNTLADILTYIRRIIKSPTNAVITDNLLIDYVNRFWIMDVDAEMQLFDLKTTYRFQTVPGVDQYNMPLYSAQTEPGNQTIGMYPVYQGFLGPAYIKGVQASFHTQKDSFFNLYPPVQQLMPIVASGNGGSSYTFQLPLLANIQPPINPPVNCILRGHVDLTGIMATGNNMDPPVADSIDGAVLIATLPTTSVFPAFYLTSIAADGSSVVVADSGIFLEGNVNYGLLMTPGAAPNGNTPLSGYSTTLNTVNYLTGQVNVNFPVTIPTGAQINAQAYFFQTGLPRAILYYNNTIILRNPPDQQYLVELEAYLTPCAFFNSPLAMPFAYMAEYVARGAARKILLDTGDVEQFNFYEPEFIRQRNLVWKRSQRQFTSTRTQTLYSQGMRGNQANNSIGNGL